MLQFNKLKLSGFKSFVDTTEMPVELGMTGIVGPNGCGKSNLVEALRWVMGETSARQMRGKDMEDVIFGGTSSRSARNIAEVALALDNSARVAPARFNDYSDLEVTRRIEREKGSVYRVNGKEVRARDVQLLFADAASGARSTALVSQGRIGQIIAQKPTERRHLLEEAAGITGLHSRRHEAELRLRAAETNTERLDDILATLESRLQGLKKQARQATRYRNLSDHIRKAEATLLHLKWTRAEADMEVSRTALQAAEDSVAELTRRTATASLEQTRAAADLPELREAEAAAAIELQRLIITRDGLGAEEARVFREQEECATRLQQVAQDIEREKRRREDAVEAIKRLDEENGALEDSRAGEDEAVQTAAETLERANSEIADLDAEHTRLTESLASAEARRTSLERTVNDLQSRLQQIVQRIDVTDAQRKALLEESDPSRGDKDAEREVENAEQALRQARGDIEKADTAREAADTAIESARAVEVDARSGLTGLEAEEKALSAMLESKEPGMFPPLVDALTVQSGYESALGAALGDDLSAPADEPSAVHWCTLLPYDENIPLPVGVERLSDRVKAPKALDRRLAQVGVVKNEQAGRQLQGALKPGQRLVSPDGWLWRWDGFTVSPDAATGAAMRLGQRNRLTDVRKDIDEANKSAESAMAATKEAREAAKAASAAQREAKHVTREAEKRLAVAREKQGALKEKAAARSSRGAALEEQVSALIADRDEVASRHRDATAAVDNLPATEDQRDALEAIRSDLVKKRSHQADCQSRHAGLAGMAQERERRISDIAGELESWHRRREDAQGQIEQLKARVEVLNAQQERLGNLPSEIEQQRRELANKVNEAERKRRDAGDALAVSEARVSDASRTLRGIESALADGREARARAEGVVEQNRITMDSMAERVAEKLQTTPANLRELAGIADDTKVPDMDAAERRVERLIRERDTMGPVNLRAEQEAGEMTEQIDTLNSERADLTAAIDKLRRGIAELNREGRRRLLEAFREMDENFQTLFVRLFDGGTAHLHLTDSDDPLEAGLEIMASPPGKKLQVLSLLSGGEQALTATALLFAAFLSNPAPICVLDEVDAPLDDANVDRFCTMLEKIAEESDTRFIVITHHRMTMSRMDRLFGVTMTERGVSQLVSVDLKQAEAIRESAGVGAA